MTSPSDVLNIALIGLGPVGIVCTTPPSTIPKRFTISFTQCASISLLDFLWKNGISYYRIIAVDPHEQRRELIKTIYTKLLEAKPGAINPDSTFNAVDIGTAKEASFSADKIGFDGVIEVSSDLNV